MRTRTTTATILAVLALTLTACGSSDGGDDKAQPSATTSSASATPTTTPSLSQAEISRQCSEAVAEVAPEWDDWNYNPGGWQDDPRTPDECLALADEEVPARGNRAFMDALTDGLEMADDPRAHQ